MPWSNEFLDAIAEDEVYPLYLLESISPGELRSFGGDLRLSSFDVAGYTNSLIPVASSVSWGRITPPTWQRTHSTLTIAVAEDSNPRPFTTRGQTVQLRMGFPGWDPSNFQAVFVGQVRNVRRGNGVWLISIVDLVGALTSRFSPNLNRNPLFYALEDTTLSALYTHGSSTTMEVADDTGFEQSTADGGEGYFFEVTPISGGDPFYVLARGKSGAVFSSLTTGLYGTVGATAGIGSVVRSGYFTSGHPLEILRRVLVSTGAGDTGSGDVINRAAGSFGIPNASVFGTPVDGSGYGFTNLTDSDYLVVQPNYTPGGWTTRTFLFVFYCKNGVNPTANQHFLDRISGALGGLTVRINTTDTVVVLGYSSAGGAVFSSGGTGAGYLADTKWWCFVEVTLGAAGVGSYQIRGWEDGNTTSTPDNASGVGGVSATVSFNQDMYMGRGQSAGVPADEVEIYDVRLYNRGLTAAECGQIVGGSNNFDSDIVWWYNGYDQFSRDQLPVSWGYGLPLDLVDEDDIEGFQDLCTPGSGSGVGELWGVESEPNGLARLLEFASGGGFFLGMHQGAVTARAIIASYDDVTPDTIEITDEDIVEIVDYSAYAEDLPIEYASVSFVDGAGTSWTSNNSDLITRPGGASYSYTVGWAWTLDLGWSLDLGFRLKPYLFRPPETLILICRGWKAAQVSPGSVVILRTQHLTSRFRESGQLDFSQGRNMLVVGGGPELFGGVTRLELISASTGGTE